MDKAQRDYLQNVVRHDTFMAHSQVNMSDLVLVTTKLKIPDMSRTVYEENPKYTKEELLADIGGALGLILGLNLLDVLVFSGSVMKVFTKKIVGGIRYLNDKKKKYKYETKQNIKVVKVRLLFLVTTDTSKGLRPRSGHIRWSHRSLPLGISNFCLSGKSKHAKSC